MEAIGLDDANGTTCRAKNETITVFPKTAEQLRKHYKLWRVSQMKKAAAKRASDSDVVKALQYNPGVVIQTTFQAHALGPVSEEEKQDDKAKEKNENDARANFDDGHVSISQLQPLAQPARPRAQFGTLYPQIPALPSMSLYPPPLPLPLYMAQTPHQPYQYRIPPPPPPTPSPHVQPRPISRKKRGRKKCLNPVPHAAIMLDFG